MTEKVINTSWMTVRDVAVDTRLSERGIRQMIAEGRLPAYKVGRSLRIRRVDVDGLFEALPTAGGDGQR